MRPDTGVMRFLSLSRYWRIPVDQTVVDEIAPQLRRDVDFEQSEVRVEFRDRARAEQHRAHAGVCQGKLQRRGRQRDTVQAAVLLEQLGTLHHLRGSRDVV